ncbi:MULTISPECIES: phosphodiesterase [Clostridium]|uniref:phosphodiesterase n=1 Tax=Clostridium TaxID=1485 RepID=UPI00082503BF|nr:MULTISPECIES: phosphodiesterase [Clostridium]PJI09327.1 metallophosphoesterase [Clostridium sp. CT7]
MKIFFMSDIHGSFYYLEKAINRFKAEKASYIVILGDELYHGARNDLPEGYNPKKVTNLLNEYSDKIIAIRGNCDSEVDEMVFDFPIMSTYSTILYKDRRLFLTHGHIYGEENMPKLSKGDVLLYGHTHIPVAKEKDGIFIINPGSISIPKGNSPHSYAVLEDNLFQIKDLDGNVFMTLEI